MIMIDTDVDALLKIAMVIEVIVAPLNLDTTTIFHNYLIVHYYLP